MTDVSVAIVILTYNRPFEIKKNVEEILEVIDSSIRVVVVDNASDYPITEVLEDYLERLEVVRLPYNCGVGGRNAGVDRCQEDIVITLDDDVYGINQEKIDSIKLSFIENPLLAALNFKIIDDETGDLTNWIHHRRSDLWSQKKFLTYEISEGAVAFRRSAFYMSGGYPDFFFISHEGPFLAFEFLKKGLEISYCPDIVVRHAHSQSGRASWRRYYYDTRNVIWLSAIHLPILMALRKIVIEILALFFYSLRDGYVRYWVRGIFHGVWELKNILKIKDRLPIEGRALENYKSIKENDPGLLYMIKLRFFNKGRKVKI